METVTIDVEPAEVMKGKAVIVKGTGKLKTYYNLFVDAGGGLFKSGIKDVDIGKYQDLNGVLQNAPDNSYTRVKNDAAGSFRAEIRTTGMETGLYIVYVVKTTENAPATPPTIASAEDEVYYRITELKVTLETDKVSYVVGEDVTISGTSPTGDYIIIAIDEEVVKYERIKADKTYEYKWTDRETKIPSTYKIGVWNYPHTVGGAAPRRLAQHNL